jgi:dipeptidyl aminopeptidase/acylaminoacyl peptidase
VIIKKYTKENLKKVPLIPRVIFFGNPDKASVRLSPDGTKISYLAPFNGVLNVWVGPSDDFRKAKPVTNDTKRGIRKYLWIYTSNHILYLQDKDGDENWRLYNTNLSTCETKNLTPIKNVQARIQEVSIEFPEEILVELNNRIPQLHDIYKINIRTGERVLIQENKGFSSFVTDNLYRVRLGLQMTSDGGKKIFKKLHDNKWDPIMKIEMEDEITTSPIGFDRSNQILYMTDSRNRNTSALTALNFETGEQTLLSEDPKTDVYSLIIHPIEKTVQAISYMYERMHWQVLDQSISEDLDYLHTVAVGDIDILSRTLDDRFWIVAYLMDKGPVRYYRYDREEKKAHFLFTNKKDLEDILLARMCSVKIKSRDNFELVCYYTLPVNSNCYDNGYPKEPLSLVLLVHGGPWGRDSWGYNPYHQWLANRGYAVLSVNFRGSTGFGKDFINAGNREWGAKMHDDLIDAVNWAIYKGIADPNRIAIMGGSYGGYATLVGMTFTPDKFVCGVDIVGPSNLITLLNTIPPYWEPQIELFAKRVGDHRTENGKKFLKERSPLTYVNRIQRPLLIGQGTNDPRVKKSESDQVVQAMKEKNIPVTYVVYPDEGHGFARPENRISFNAVLEAFLAKYLGGRFESINQALKGSSITVQSGIDKIYGLSKALKERS